MPKGLLTPPDVAYRPRRIELLPIRSLCVKGISDSETCSRNHFELDETAIQCALQLENNMVTFRLSSAVLSRSRLIYSIHLFVDIKSVSILAGSLTCQSL